MSTATIVHDSPTYRKEIRWDRETKDYALALDGALVGYARTYHEGEVTLDALVFELMSGETTLTALPPERCPTCGSDGSPCVDCNPAPIDPPPTAPASPSAPAGDDESPALPPVATIYDAAARCWRDVPADPESILSDALTTIDHLCRCADGEFIRDWAMVDALAAHVRCALRDLREVA